ncbi:MAG: riboflavin synthase [Opitutales bacterium]
MFTGIVEETGVVRSFEEREEAWRLLLDVETVTDDLRVGDSVAVNGCCLTAVVVEPGRLAFDLLEESIRLTSIEGVGPGGKVNLERALLPTTRMGGHFVSGHVDGTGEVEVLEQRGKDYYLKVRVEPSQLKYVVHKGCISIDGISLTVADLDHRGFGIWLIPHTMEVTNLQDKRAGDRVNLEFDLIAKYVERLMIGNDA